MEKDKLLSMLGLCRKAGRLRQGFDVVKESTLKGDIDLLIISDEISGGTLRGISDVAGYTDTPLEILPITMQELGEKTGKKAGVLGIADEGFAGAIKKLIEAEGE